MTSFWQELETKKLTKPEIEKYLTQKLGEPQTELQHNLLFELVKKINSYYSEEPQQSSTAYFLSGQVQEIVEKRFAGNFRAEWEKYFTEKNYLVKTKKLNNG